MSLVRSGLKLRPSKILKRDLQTKKCRVLGGMGTEWGEEGGNDRSMEENKLF